MVEEKQKRNTIELTKKERNLVFQIASGGKEGILNELSMECSHTTDQEKQDTILLLMNKFRCLKEGKRSQHIAIYLQ